MVAFLEHRRLLRASRTLSPDERKLLDEMNVLIDSLPPQERTALDAKNGGGEVRRLRERAERRLRRELVARGILAG